MASVPTIFRLYDGSMLMKSIQVPGVNLFNTTGTQFQIVDSTFILQPSTSSPEYKLSFFENGEAGAKGWLDWITLQGRRSNYFRGTALQIYDSRSVAQGRITEFSFTNTDNGIIVLGCD